MPPIFPQRMTVGGPEKQTTYELVPNQFLIKVAEDADVDAVRAFLGAERFERDVPPPHIQRAQATLAAAGLRWVTLPSQFASAAAAEAFLTERDEVTEVRPIYFQAGGGPETAATPIFDQLIIRIAEGQQDEVIAALADLGLEHNAVASQYLAPFHLFRVVPVPGRSLFDLGQDLAQQAAVVDGVLSVEFDWLKLETYTFKPNDPEYGDQWDMRTIDAPFAWDVETGAMEVVIAIIDSGFDLSHPDLWFTPNTASNPTHFNAEDALNGDPPPYDASPSGVGHGTAVAGIAAGIFNNGKGVAGVAGGCRIMPVRLGSVPTSARVAAGIRWATDHGAHVANMSFGTTETAAARDAVVYAWGRGVVLCATTGNHGGDTSSPAIGFPGNHANTIAVGASDQDDERKRPESSDDEWWWGSQYGPEIDVVAPGVLLPSTDEQGASGYDPGDYTPEFGGTSGAAPHVTGLAGLIRSANRALTARQVRDIIESTCDKISPAIYTYATVAGKGNGTWHEQVGYGRINAARALTAATARNQAVAIADNQEFVVVWADDRDRNGYYQIWARGFHANGSQRFAPFTVNSVGSGQQIRPAIGMAPNGDFVVVWQDDKDQNGYYQIWARGFYADGSERFHDMTVNSYASGQQLKPAVAMASNGDFVVVWEDDKDENGYYQIRARGFHANGGERFHDMTVNSAASGQQLKPAIGMASDGDFVVVWQDDKDENGYYQILARGFHANGGERFHDMTVNSYGSGQQLKPAIAMAPDGDFVVVWEDDKDQNGYYQIRARGFQANGSERFHDMTVNSVPSGQQLRPAVGMANDGGFVVAWQDDRNENGWGQILARGFHADGGEHFHDMTVNSNPAGHQLRPSVAVDDEGKFVVSWQDDRDGNGYYRAYVRGFHAGGTERFADQSVH